MKRGTIIIFLIFLLIIAGVAYWQFFVRGTSTGSNGGTTTSQPGFVPFNRDNTPTNSGSGSQQQTNTSNTASSTPISGKVAKIPTLRLLSSTPVGGYGASSTPTVTIKATKLASSTQILGTTHIRWVDRGRGNIFEALGNTLEIKTLSNTVVPKIYESTWNKNLTAFMALSVSGEDYSSMSGVYAELKPRVMPKVATSTASSSPQTDSQNATAGSLTPYELKGKNLPENIVAYAVSPKKDRVFMFINNNGTGVGYTSNFDGSSPAQIFTTPITQVNVEWPSDNIIAITTKGTADESGFLYFVDAKTGVWRKILGPLNGLSTKVSADSKYVFASMTGSNENIVTRIYNVATGKRNDAVINTLADKCVWGNFYKDIVYCAVPSQPIKAVYPDDWYKGSISFIDKIWQANAITGEVKLISSIIDTSDRIVDAFNLGLDAKDDFLIFMNKNDLSLWSLDLVGGN